MVKSCASRGAARRVVLGIEIEHQRLAGSGKIELAPVACSHFDVPEPCRLRHHAHLSLMPFQSSAILCRAASCAASSSSQLETPQACATSATSPARAPSPRARPAAASPACAMSNFSAPTYLRVDQDFGRPSAPTPPPAGFRPTCVVSWSTWTANSRSTSPPGPSLTSSGPRGGLWRAISARICRGVRLDRHRNPAASRRMSAMSCGSLLPRRDRPGHRPGPAQRHMLPGPGFVALISLERIEADGQHPLARPADEAACRLRRAARRPSAR